MRTRAGSTIASIIVLLLLSSAHAGPLQASGDSMVPFVEEPEVLSILVRLKKSGTGTLKGIFVRLCACGHLSRVAKSLPSCGGEEIYIRYGNGGRNDAKGTTR